MPSTAITSSQAKPAGQHAAAQGAEEPHRRPPALRAAAQSQGYCCQLFRPRLEGKREREKGKKNPEECGLRNSPCICMDVRGEGEGFSALVPLVGLEAREFLFILMSELRQKKKKKRGKKKRVCGLYK